MAALEQRSAIIFCVANKKSRQETFEMLKTAFGNNTMNKTALYKRYSKCEQGDISVTDEPRPGCPSIISSKKNRNGQSAVDSDQRMTVRDITIRTGYTFTTVFRITHNELGMRRICARWIPHIIDENQMRKRMPVMLQTAILYHDNAPLHRAAQTTETIKRHSLKLLDNPLNHQTWPLVIFFLFPLIKSVLRGARFEDVADRPVAVQQAIAEIPVNSKREWFLYWVKRCRRCVD